MKTLIVFDSDYGNTKKLSLAVAAGFLDRSEIVIRHVNNVEPDLLVQIETLIVGSPTRGNKATQEILGFLNKIPKNGLQSIAIAAFDSRQKRRGFSLNIFPIFRRKKRSAAKMVDQQLLKKGGIQVMAPEGFYMKSRRGPVYRSELSRAMQWGREIEVLLP